MENVRVKDIVDPLVSSVQGDGWGVQADEGQGGDDQGGAGGNHQEGWGDESWGGWAGGEGHCEEGRNVSMRPSARREEHLTPAKQPVTHPVGRLNDAFQTALFSHDLVMVVFTCVL